MRTVFSNNREVAHVWAQQSQASGRGHNFYFDGPTIYSYGSHFPIARFVTNERDERAVLFTTRRYSKSTSRHVSYAAQALYGLNVPVFNVRDVEGDPPYRDGEADSVAAEYRERIHARAKSAALARLEWGREHHAEA